jgi:hypothetical protein
MVFGFVCLQRYYGCSGGAESVFRGLCSSERTGHRDASHLDDPRLVHGVLTYDYFSMIRAIGDEGSALAKPADWTEVHFPAGAGDSRTNQRRAVGWPVAAGTRNYKTAILAKRTLEESHGSPQKAERR